MPKIDQKQEIVRELKEKLQSSKTTIVADYRGLKVAEANELRNMLRKSGVEYRVVKNTMVSFAAQDAGLADLEQLLAGPTALAFSPDDPVIPAKLLTEYARTHKQLSLKGGVLEGKLIGPEGIKALAELPSREVLLAQVVGAFQAPISNWVSLLQAPIQQLTGLVDSLRQKREEAGTA